MFVWFGMLAVSRYHSPTSTVSTVFLSACLSVVVVACGQKSSSNTTSATTTMNSLIFRHEQSLYILLRGQSFNFRWEPNTYSIYVCVAHPDLQRETIKKNGLISLQHNHKSLIISRNNWFNYIVHVWNEMKWNWRRAENYVYSIVIQRTIKLCAYKYIYQWICLNWL